MPERMGERRILIVEDEKVVADTLGQILSAHGYDLRIAYSAEDALGIIAHWHPNVGVLDVMLPQMNGIELAVVLKENHPDPGTTTSGIRVTPAFSLDRTGN